MTIVYDVLIFIFHICICIYTYIHYYNNYYYTCVIYVMYDVYMNYIPIYDDDDDDDDDDENEGSLSTKKDLFARSGRK